MNDSAVISYIIGRWCGWVIVSLLLVILFTVFSLKRDIRKYRWWILACLALYTVYVTVPTVLGLKDIRTQAYITAHVEYYRADESNTHTNWAARDSIQITLDSGEGVILRGARSDLPFGKYTGKVTYAERSKIIIDFAADTES